MKLSGHPSERKVEGKRFLVNGSRRSFSPGSLLPGRWWPSNLFGVWERFRGRHAHATMPFTSTQLFR
jgi:hypothetical protein